ncbi:putative transcriptional regulator [Haemophilus pittmaniae]|uniref:UPF0301 protein NCTC13335_01010 n=3 Tax=Haemophilus pittmaniae TaxID=249188 RepID=A0A377IXZ4_9PAST|nr:putative transcriptional regulator [Haemophilus pittmaniae]STO96189.1 putative transcriptional regulator [Haemophilus pittmaniae]
MNLQGQLLIAMPHVKDYFEQAVILICEHNAQGAMGVMINYPTDLSIAELYSKLNLMSINNRQFSQRHVTGTLVLTGGPVHSERGFIVHTKSKTEFEHSYPISDNLWLTTSADIINTFGSPDAPENYLVALGCANWAPGQLEQEIADNVWLVAPSNNYILFHTRYDDRYSTASRQLRIYGDNLVPEQMGHA